MHTMARSTQKLGGPCGSAQLGQSQKAFGYNQKADSGQFCEGPEGGGGGNRKWIPASAKNRSVIIGVASGRSRPEKNLG